MDREVIFLPDYLQTPGAILAPMRTMMLCIGPAAVAGALALAACTIPPSHTAATSPAVQPPAAPEPVSMDPSLALGLWHSSFGAVKIEQDTGRGTDAIMGVWIYQRDGEEVMGFFSGTMRGNVLDFNWHEPAPAGDLTGGGYLAFDPQGGRFNGNWWTQDRSRGNIWYGWRADRAANGPDPGSL